MTIDRARTWLRTAVFASFLCAAQGAFALSLDGDVRAILGDKALAHSAVGVAIAKVGTGGSSGAEFLFKSNANAPLMPASNLKVVTSSAALAILGPDFKFQTLLLYRDGDLFIIGDGDPTLGDPEVASKVGWSSDYVFAAWAGELKKRGITTIRNVYIDDSIFDQNFAHPNWPADQLDHAYLAQVSGLSFHFNTLGIAIKGNGSVATTPPTSYVSLTNEAKLGAKSTVGASRKQGTNVITVFGTVKPPGGETFEVTIHDPALYTGTVFSETLKREGVNVTGVVSRDTNVRGAYQKDSSLFTPVSTLETPIAAVLARCNKDSANLYAESLAKRLAAKATGKPGSWEGSRASIGDWLQRIGVPPEQFHLDDGCGLSRNNGISAEGMVRILATDYAASYRKTFLDSLAVGGEDGTLEKRFKGMEGRVHAKSGFINGVSTLSGFLQSKGGDWYAFSILLNHISGGKPIHERIVRALDNSVK